MMALMNQLFESSASNRLLEIQERERRPMVKGDFEGSVTGTWIALDRSGLGLVSYMDKKYLTRSLGLTSIKAGKPVQLTHANGVYYSTW